MIQWYVRPNSILPHGVFTVPARTTAVFELPQSEEVEVVVVEEEPEVEATAVPVIEPTAEPMTEEPETTETPSDR